MEKFDPETLVHKPVPDDLCAKVCETATQMASLCLAGGFSTLEVQVGNAAVSFKRLDRSEAGQPFTRLRA